MYRRKSEAQTKQFFNEADLNMRLQQATGTSISLKMSYDNAKIIVSQKSARLEELRSENYRLREQHAQKLQEIKEIEAKLYKNIALAENYESQLHYLMPQKDRLEQEILKLQEIFNEPAPVPTYGYRCINGVLNCTNHPLDHSGGQVLSNEDEINAYEKRAEQTEEQLRKKRQELWTLETQLVEISDAKLSAEVEAQNAESDYYRATQAVRNIEDDIQQNQQWFNLKNQEYADARADLSEYKQAVMQAEQLVSDLQQKMPSRGISRDMLMAIAQQELAMEMNQPLTASSLSQKDIEKIARAELAEEQAQIVNAMARLGIARSNEPDSMRQAPLDDKSQISRRANEEPEETDSVGIVDDLTQGFNKIRKGAGRFFDGARQTVREVQQLGHDIGTTVSDMYPTPVGFAINTIFEGPNGVREILDQPATHTGNIIIDYVNRNSKP